MRAGNLDRLITIQRKTTSFSTSGAPNETWAALKHRCAAGYRPLRGEERFSTAQDVASEQVEFLVRHAPGLADLSPLDRILYEAPAEQNVQAPDLRTVWDILAVHELGRGKGLRVVAERRADA
jgi:head-tail adaptor